MKTRPLVVTLGDPAGIGPEIAIKAWQALDKKIPFVLLADRRFFPAFAVRCGIATQEIASDAEVENASALPFLHHPLHGEPTPGVANNTNAASVISMIETAVRLVQQGRCSALVTNPINKLVLKEGANFAFPGHTEFLAHISGSTARPVMMLASPLLRVVPATIHIPLADVPTALTGALLEETILTTHDALCRYFGLTSPRLAISGLNPHAGEGGTIGREEIATIIPVVQKLRAQGLNLLGPLPADTMFHPSARAKYDAAICMYHDQALLPLKTLDFANGVNVTLGLPFIRTSPDHGTAFDIAGQGKADPSSLIAAIQTAWDMVQAQT